MPSTLEFSSTFPVIFSFLGSRSRREVCQSVPIARQGRRTEGRGLRAVDRASLPSLHLQPPLHAGAASAPRAEKVQPLLPRESADVRSPRAALSPRGPGGDAQI